MGCGFNPFRKRCKLRVEKHEYLDPEKTSLLHKGDIILHRGQYSSFLSALIMEFTRSPYAHAEVYVGNGWAVSAEPQGITLTDHWARGFVDVMRMEEGFTREVRGIVLEKAYQSLAMPYEYLGLFGFPFGSEKAAAKRAANSAYICSEVVAWCYKEAKIDLITGRPESIESPADLAHSPKLVWKGSWRNGEAAPEAKRNEFDPSQLDKEAGFAKWLIKNIADALSDRDERYRKLAERHAQGNRQEHYVLVESIFKDYRKASQQVLQKAAEKREGRAGKS